jgi:NAD(P)-dependent dehydrogenase (short-subunit alcohol dehydrogenase family)
VVNVSSRMHRLATVPRRDPHLRRRFSSVAAYSVSKTAQVRKEPVPQWHWTPNRASRPCSAALNSLDADIGRHGVHPGYPRCHEASHTLLSEVVIGASRALQVALTLDLQRRLDAGGANVRCFAADPGEVLTDITRTLPRPLRAMYKALLPWILFTPAQGAAQAQGLASSHATTPVVLSRRFRTQRTVHEASVLIDLTSVAIMSSR